MSIAERYIKASKSSHLELKLSEACDLDMMIASGMVRETLGIMLFRVRAEFDRVMSENRKAKTNFLAQVEIAADQAKHPDKDETKEEAAEKGRATLKAAEIAALTNRALIMVQMGSLEPVARAVGAYAVTSAIRGNLGSTEDMVRKIAGQVLDVFLDTTCPACEGRSFTGGYGVAMVMCTTCRATGKRQPSYGKTAAEHDFGRWLLDDLSAKMHEAERLMRSKLRQR